MTTPPEWEYRQRVQDLLRGYRPAQVLITCTELGVFEMLGDAPASAEELGQRLGVSPFALARLLNAAVALGLLEKRGEAYTNAGEGPFYLGNLVQREGAFFRRWSRLTEAIRTGQRPEENIRDEGQTTWVRDFDLALLFGILVSEPPADTIALLQKIHSALVPGGIVAIRGFYLDPDRSGPPDAALFDLHMLLSTGAGAAHTTDDVTEWLNEAGFPSPQTVHLPPPEHSSLLVARKPV